MPGDPALARWANVWHAYGVEEKETDGPVASDRVRRKRRVQRAKGQMPP